jgi:hypothetical protein
MDRVRSLDALAATDQMEVLGRLKPDLAARPMNVESSSLERPGAQR